ncbi:MAG TPA: cupin domain-containing protein [Gemmatimonadaceae bacterium]|nr:cupin domain-containing protein [Gemmatimonadaceae bacterium]
MSPVRHSVTGEALSFALSDEMEIVRQALAKSPGRIARTLSKNGELRATLVGVSPGGALQEHSSSGPITIQVLEGAIELQAAGQKWPLSAGMLLALEAGVLHAVTSDVGGFFLLTVVKPREGSERHKE